MTSNSYLPKGWKKMFSQSQGREYFFHIGSGKSVWKIEDLPNLNYLIQREAKMTEDAKGNANDEDNSSRATNKTTVDTSYSKPCPNDDTKGLDSVSSQNGDDKISLKRHLDENENDSGEGQDRFKPLTRPIKSTKSEQNNEPMRVVIIVPFRDEHETQSRGEHLRKFIPHMTAFLGENKVRFAVFGILNVFNFCSEH